jgi:site-specific recombinase XerD
MEQAVKDFLRYLEVIRHRSPHTLRGYGRELAEALAGFRLLLGKDDLTLAHLSPALLHNHIAQVSQRGRCASTVCHTISALKSWCGWMERQGLIANSPAVGLRGPRVLQVASLHALRRCEEVAVGTEQELPFRLPRLRPTLFGTSANRLTAWNATDIKPSPAAPTC